MTASDITIATPAARDTVVGSLVAAFVNDPVLRYLFPDARTYPRYAAAFFGNLFDKRVHRSSIWTIGGGASVAIWEETSNPANVELYRRAGWEVVDSLSEPVPTWIMQQRTR
ncbi:hypothetical protein [Micromonospora sp. 067-2]|uniref:hypothetical protein n=1 Tax=Micromonospora sp. 067-2 TaxID=2789270 RepID=UPI00397C47E0